MADAVHDLGGSLSIGSAWYLQKVGTKRATNGFKCLSLMGAMINRVVLVNGSVWVLFAAAPRLFATQMPHTERIFLFALLEIAVNGFAAYKLSSGKSLNERILNWHLL
jgi:cobalt-zinc-cadmium efflux system protein